MGYIKSPEIQQRIGRFLLRPIVLMLPLVASTLHVDNFRFAGHAAESEKALKALRIMCKQYNISIGDPAPESIIQAKYRHNFLGIDWNYTEKTIALTSKFVAKLQNITIGETMTWHDMESLYGKLFFGAQILGLGLAQFYYALKQFRLMAKICSRMQTSNNHIVKLWQASKSQLLTWFDIVSTNRPREMIFLDVALENSYKHVLYTDASDKGFSCVLFTGTTFEVYANRWENERFWKDEAFLPDIGQRELFALVVAIKWLRHKNVQLNETILCIDNCTALSAAQKGYSKSFWINSLIIDGNIDAGFLRQGFFKRIFYVTSAENLADIFTRELAPEGEEALQAHGEMPTELQGNCVTTLGIEHLGSPVSTSLFSSVKV